MMLSLFKAKAIIPYQSRRQRTDLGYPTDVNTDYCNVLVSSLRSNTPAR